MFPSTAIEAHWRGTLPSAKAKKQFWVRRFGDDDFLKMVSTAQSAPLLGFGRHCLSSLRPDAKYMRSVQARMKGKVHGMAMRVSSKSSADIHTIWIRLLQQNDYVKHATQMRTGLVDI